MKRIFNVVALSAVSTGAFAALPAGVETAITGAGTDAGLALAAIIVVAVGIWALRKIVGLFGR